MVGSTVRLFYAQRASSIIRKMLFSTPCLGLRLALGSLLDPVFSSHSRGAWSAEIMSGLATKCTS